MAARFDTSVNERNYYLRAQEFGSELRRVGALELGAQGDHWVARYYELQEMYALASADLSGRSLEVLEDRHAEINQLAQRLFPQNQRIIPSEEQHAIALELRNTLRARSDVETCFLVFKRLAPQVKQRAYQLLCEVHIAEEVPPLQVKAKGIDLFLADPMSLLTVNPRTSLRIIDELIRDLEPSAPSLRMDSSSRQSVSPELRRGHGLHSTSTRRSPQYSRHEASSRSSGVATNSQRRADRPVFSTSSSGLSHPSIHRRETSRPQRSQLPPPPSEEAHILPSTMEDLIFALSQFGREQGVEFDFVGLPPPSVPGIRFGSVGREPESAPIFPARITSLAQRLRRLLPSSDKGQFDTFMQNVLGMKDCETERGRRKVFARLEQILDGACRNPKFRKTMASLFPQANASCGDRFSYYFGEIETHWHIACDPKAETPEGLAKLLIGLRRKKLLDEYAESLAHSIGNYEEEIETVVALRAALAEEFELPVSIRDIRHHGCAGVTPQDIQEARQLLNSTKERDVMAEILLENETWREMMKPRADRMIKAVIKESEDVFGAVDDVEYSRDQDKEDVMKDIQRQREFETLRSLRRATLQFLSSRGS
jgi:hypothetical protein